MSVPDDASEVAGTAELDELRAVLRAALDDLAPLARTAGAVEATASWDAVAWRTLCGHVALPGLGLPEAYGGQGFGPREQCVALEETGRVLYPGPYLAGVLAGGALLLSGNTDACAQLMPGVADGSRTLALAVTDRAAPTTAVRGPGGTVVLDGEKVAVLAGSDAADIVVSAHCGGTPTWVVVDRDAPGIDVTPVPVLDLTRRMATVTLRGAEGTEIVSEHPGVVLESALRTLALGALAAEQAGAARGALDLTIAHATSRIQFGRQLGSFQAIRHRLADLYAEVELASAAAREAAGAAEDRFSDDAAISARAAHSCCTDAFKLVAREMIQLHGGLGFTWEHAAHLYFKRAKASELLLGGAETSRAELGRLLLF